MSTPSLMRWLLGRLCKLPPRVSGRLQVEKGLKVPMRDGIELLADRYFIDGHERAPVVIMRSPYGRGAIFSLMAALIAERGFQVILQSVRGTAGSTGTLNPMRQERNDGVDTIAWIRSSSWFSDKLFAFGGSYLGNAVWAMAKGAGEQLDGAAVAMTLSNFRDELLGFGGFTQAGTLGWTQTALMLSEPGAKMQRPKPGSLDVAHQHLPVGTMDQVAFGKSASWWQQWTAHDDPDDAWWHEIDQSSAVSEWRAPVAMVAGWQDIFLPFQLRDFQTRQQAGKPVSIVVGPWSHSAPGGMVEGLRQSIELFSRLASDRVRRPVSPVRIYLQGAGEWRDYSQWPPAAAVPLQLYLRTQQRLTKDGPATNEGSVQYLYDPADPTPSVHGPMVMGGSKKRDMWELERRSDTVMFTSEPLDRDIDAIGAVKAELCIRSDREDTDFYVCICDVGKGGGSLQVLDGYLRLRPGMPLAGAAGVRRVAIECWPTAYRFRRGHCIRVIVASGAFPRYARNLGTGEPLATATRMVPAQLEILHSAEYPSSVTLQVVPTN